MLGSRFGMERMQVRRSCSTTEPGVAALMSAESSEIVIEPLLLKSYKSKRKAARVCQEGIGVGQAGMGMRGDAGRRLGSVRRAVEDKVEDE